MLSLECIATLTHHTLRSFAECIHSTQEIHRFQTPQSDLIISALAALPPLEGITLLWLLASGRLDAVGYLLR